MSPLSASEGPLGLRERKKLKTRAAIQKHALRLIRKQGYAATTVEQIAAAAEVSPSTFFRYFPSKEDVVLFDATDPLMLDSFEAQPPELSVVEALRRAIHEVYANMSADEMARERERQGLVRGEPELRAKVMDAFADAIVVTVDLLSKRVGRPPDDLAVRTYAGALIGALMSVYVTAADRPDVDLMELFEQTLTQFEAGFEF